MGQIVELRPQRLTHHQEIELSRIIEAGLFAQYCLDQGRYPHGASSHELQVIIDEGKQACQIYVDANIGMIRKLAKRWSIDNAIDIEDLIHEGYLALIEAIYRFDYTLGWRFSTLAWTLIAQQLAKAAVAEQSCGSSTLAHARRLRLIEKTRDRLVQSGCAEVTTSQLADELGVPEYRVRRESIMPNKTMTNMDQLSSDRPAKERIDLSWLSRLPRDERYVLIWSFGLCGERAVPQSVIATRLGLSVSGVSRLKRKAIQRCRRVIEDSEAA